jgi:hypothetical protein
MRRSAHWQTRIHHCGCCSLGNDPASSTEILGYGESRVVLVVVTTPKDKARIVIGDLFRYWGKEVRYEEVTYSQ